MKLICLFFILWTTSTACSNETTKDYLDPFDDDDHVFLLKSLFTKLNTILNGTDQLSKGLLDLNHRFDDLNRRQEDQENRVKNTLENFHLELNKRLDTQEKLLSGYLKQSQTWHTILRRQDGSVNFDRNWNEYQNGFGNSIGEFFIGLDKLHAMTTYGPAQELLVVLKDFENQTRYAKYNLFRIGSEAEKYAILELGAYSGDAEDALSYHNGTKFSTSDQDNDTNDDGNCAQHFNGGWWFIGCYTCDLTGPYRNESDSQRTGIGWHTWKGKDYSLKFAEMMIRPKL